MESFASKSSVTHRSIRYLAACLLTSTALACASDDSDAAQDEESQTATKDSDDKSTKDAKDTSDQKTATEDKNTAKDGPAEISKEEAAKRDEDANPGSAAVMRFDGKWTGKTAQDKPVSLKILNRFLAHIEVGYQLEGDDCSAEESLVKLSAMQPLRMAAFMLTNTTETEKLVMSGKFTADDAAEGTYTIEVVGEAPKGCKTSVSGTWKASK